MKKNELHMMTWKEVAAAFENDPVIFVPFGSMEEHGPHSITGDYLAAYEIAKRAAEKTDNYCLPVIPYGYSEYFRPFPGTISISPETLYRLVSDILESLIEHGISKIIIVNGHAGNSSIMDALARDIRRKHQIMLGKIDLWQSLSPAFKKELYGDVNPMGHGGEPLTSVMHYLYPDYMRMDLVKESDRATHWHGMEISNISKTPLGDVEASMYFNMDEVTQQGVMGNPFIGNAETGEKIINRLVDYFVVLANKMKVNNMRIDQDNTPQ